MSAALNSISFVLSFLAVATLPLFFVYVYTQVKGAKKDLLFVGVAIFGAALLCLQSIVTASISLYPDLLNLILVACSVVYGMFVFKIFNERKPQIVASLKGAKK